MGGVARNGRGMKICLAPDGFPVPPSNKQRETFAKTSARRKWHTSPFGDFPSSRIRRDICPPPPLPGSGTAADSQIKIARGTIQTLRPFCRECLLTAPLLKRLERGEKHRCTSSLGHRGRLLTRKLLETQNVKTGIQLFLLMFVAKIHI